MILEGVRTSSDFPIKNNDSLLPYLNSATQKSYKPSSLPEYHLSDQPGGCGLHLLYLALVDEFGNFRVFPSELGLGR